jgi:hypothetical protein
MSSVPFEAVVVARSRRTAIAVSPDSGKSRPTIRTFCASWGWATVASPPADVTRLAHRMFDGADAALPLADTVKL